MYKITNRQFEVFQAAALEDYIMRMLQHIKTEYPEVYYVKENTDLRVLIEENVRIAEAFFLTEEYAVTRLLDYRILFGNDFLSEPAFEWVLDTLNDESYSDIKK
ncbi:MAG: hypothetical protein OMM_12672 [Candidatus Magnetoglobus multicellularis str. Araruama]|uniref:Uncharacterized protein n=1 Tax=Candidatus Magnetoglobus multicellularis str. Araruama TaxID=890399 RepID=A0A1V1NVF4_9BACT|nr:MAG: hypothetical protein OMM_12672 [Candidatus Magnetoglobus multicellularis str. Araruama]